jgi:hypothetical protein
MSAACRYCTGSGLLADLAEFGPCVCAPWPPEATVTMPGFTATPHDIGRAVVYSGTTKVRGVLVGLLPPRMAMVSFWGDPPMKVFSNLTFRTPLLRPGPSSTSVDATVKGNAP